MRFYYYNVRPFLFLFSSSLNADGSWNHVRIDVCSVNAAFLYIREAFMLLYNMYENINNKWHNTAVERLLMCAMGWVWDWDCQDTHTVFIYVHKISSSFSSICVNSISDVHAHSPLCSASQSACLPANQPFHWTTYNNVHIEQHIICIT